MKVFETQGLKRYFHPQERQTYWVNGNYITWYFMVYALYLGYTIIKIIKLRKLR
jgi:hypothetical protein